MVHENNVIVIAKTHYGLKHPTPSCITIIGYCDNLGQHTDMSSQNGDMHWSK